MSKNLRILVIGTGSIGERHIRCLLATDRASVGVCEVDSAQRERVAEKYGVAGRFASLKDALDAVDWGGAVIATPAHTHIPLALQLVASGITPLIEKPLATGTDRVDELCQASAKSGIVPGVAYVLRSHPAAIAMREAINSGRFGRPRQVISYSGHCFPEARPAYRYIYFADRSRGGGAIQDSITHNLNLTEWFVGPITQVRADACHQYLDGVEVEDTVHVISRHGNVMGSHTLNLYQAPAENSITVVCEAGTARLELHNHRWRWMQNPNSQWCDEPADIKDRDTYFTLQEHAYLDQLEYGRAPLCSLEEGAQTLRVNVAVFSSSERGNGWVSTK